MIIFLSASIISSGFFPTAIKSQVVNRDTIIIKLELNTSETELAPAKIEGDPGLGLALSGGGSRALADIGILKVLDRENIKVSFITGVSMGAIVGGLYSAGYSPEEIENIAMSIQWKRLFSQSPVRSSLPPTQKGRPEKSILKIRFVGWRLVIPKALTTGQNLRQYLETLSAKSGIRPSISFDYLNPPLRIISTDLSTGERVVLSSGSLAEAMRASIAVPVAFTPVNIDGRWLVDGGLVDPIPVDILRGNYPGPAIAVDASSGLLPVSTVDNVMDIADQVTTIMSMDRKKESLEQADLVISPNLKGRVSSDFSDIHSIIAAGEKAAEKALPDIKALLDKKREIADQDTGYQISDWRIKGLSSMPVTFYKSVFMVSDRMTADEIEFNLKRALESGYISDCRADLIPSGTGYNIEYSLVDNGRIDKIEFVGVTLFKIEDLTKLIKTKPGMILNYNTILSDKKALESFYIESGYSLARVTSRFRERDRMLIFTVDEGRINNILVEGNQRTRNWVVRRHVPFHRGDVFRQVKADRGVEDLYGTDLFETARFIAIPDTLGVTLKAVVSEKAFKFIRSGARYDLEYGPKAFFDLVDDNMFGAGLELYFSTTVGEKRRSASMNFEADRIWNTYYTYRLVFDYGELKRNHYFDHERQRTLEEFRHGGELSLGRQIPRLGTIFAFGQIRRYRWDEPGRTERQIFDKASIGIHSIVDTRDALDFPEKGKYHVFDLEFSGNLASERSTYTRIFTSFESYYRLTGRLNVHPKISLGISSNILPYFDKFTLGGQTNFPGLFSDEILGEKSLVGEFLFRYRVFDPLYLTSSLNFGNIWKEIESIRFSEMRLSGGIGLAVKTPIGPIALSYGRTDRGNDAFYLSAGYDW